MGVLMNQWSCTSTLFACEHAARRWWRSVLSSGCATTGPHACRLRVEIQDDVGFTITEDTRISNDVRLDYDLALTELGQGRLEQGVQMLETVVESAPTLSAPLIDLGIAYHRNGDLEAAEQTLRSGRRIESRSSDRAQ